jgi:hypothetical protein
MQKGKVCVGLSQAIPHFPISSDGSLRHPGGVVECLARKQEFFADIPWVMSFDILPLYVLHASTNP